MQRVTYREHDFSFLLFLAHKVEGEAMNFAGRNIVDRIARGRMQKDPLDHDATRVPRNTMRNTRGTSTRHTVAYTHVRTSCLASQKPPRTNLIALKGAHETARTRLIPTIGRTVRSSLNRDWGRKKKSRIHARDAHAARLSILILIHRYDYRTSIPSGITIDFSAGNLCSSKGCSYYLKGQWRVILRTRRILCGLRSHCVHPVVCHLRPTPQRTRQRFPAQRSITQRLALTIEFSGDATLHIYATCVTYVSVKKIIFHEKR